MLGIRPEKIFQTSSQIKVLRVLWRSGKPLTGRQVQDLAGLANLSAMQSLKRLVDLGVVSCRRAGRAHQYELKRKTWAVRELISPLFESEEKGMDRLFEILKKTCTDHCQSAYLYGSVLESGGEKAGDLDLFLVVEKEKERSSLEKSLIPEISRKLSEEFALFLEPNIITVPDLDRGSVRKMAENIAENGRKICGTNLEKLIPK